MPAEPTSDTPQNSSGLERVRESLYAQNAPTAFSLPGLHQEEASAPTAWEPEEPPIPGHLSFAVKFLIGAIAFFLLAGGVTAGLLIHGSRSISSDRIDILVQGPTTIASGDTVPLIITIKNNNPTTILDTSFTIDLPPGTRTSTASSTALDHYTDTLGNLAPGAVATRSVTAIMFGPENQPLSIPMHLEYRSNGSTAVFQKDKQYVLTVSTSPVSVQVSTVAQSASGQQVTVAVQVKSNGSAPLQNIALLGEYPSGFTVASSNPIPTPGTPFFLIGTLAPGAEKDFTIRGTLVGAEGARPAFNFTVGTAAGNGNPSLDIPYTSAQASVEVTKPLVGLTLALNHDSTNSSLTATAGQPIVGLVTWVNTLASTVTNAQVSVQFSGNAFDPNGVVTGTGVYRVSDDSIIFDSTTNPGLAALHAGDTGNGTFTLTPRSADSLRGVHNPSITATVSVSGTRTDGLTGSISTTLSRTIQLGSAVSLTAQATHTGGAFTNAGPLTPHVGVESDYAITLTANSSVNTVGSSVVTVALPAGVRYTGASSPASASITYDDTTRTVSWNVGDVVPGASSQVAFQVALTPTASQKGQVAPLATGISLTGTDRFTKQQVSAQAPNLTTDVTTDSAYRAGYGKVAQ